MYENYSEIILIVFSQFSAYNFVYLHNDKRYKLLMRVDLL